MTMNKINVTNVVFEAGHVDGDWVCPGYYTERKIDIYPEHICTSRYIKYTLPLYKSVKQPVTKKFLFFKWESTETIIEYLLKELKYYKITMSDGNTYRILEDLTELTSTGG